MTVFVTILVRGMTFCTLRINVCLPILVCSSKVTWSYFTFLVIITIFFTVCTAGRYSHCFSFTSFFFIFVTYDVVEDGLMTVFLTCVVVGTILTLVETTSLAYKWLVVTKRLYSSAWTWQ